MRTYLSAMRVRTKSPHSLGSKKCRKSKKELPFIGLPDPELKVLNLYGQEFRLLKLGRMPAQAIVDKKGQVRFAHYGHSMSDIPRNNEILNLLDQLIIDQFVSGSET